MEENANTTISDFNIKSLLIFSWSDYTIFAFMLGVSAVIGIYFGFCGKNKQDNTEEYLLGGKKMGIFPVSVSLIASHISGITLLGVPADVYLYGTAYWTCILSGIIVSVIVAYVYLPVFYELQLTSSFEYLQLRFDKRIRNFASFLYVLSMILYIPIVIYIPALAFSQVTGVNLYAVAPTVCVVCIFYTTIGGLRAVVWTDTVQYIVTIISMFAVVYIGTNHAGGFKKIWETAEKGGRIDFFNMDPSLTARCTFWGITVGLTVSWIAHLGVNQGCIQKFISIPTLKNSQKSVFFFCIGLVVTKSISCFTGLIMYSEYVNCDPLSSGLVKRTDQILPYYVMDVARNVIGLPGLFIAGVFNTALSTMSAALNTVAGALYTDFIAPLLPDNTSEKCASTIMKVAVIIIGTICVGLVVLVDRLGGILQLSITLSSVTTGPMFGLFTLGILFPWANSYGALSGVIASIFVETLVVVGSQYHFVKGQMKYPTLELSVKDCMNITSTMSVLNETSKVLISQPAKNDEVFFLFQLSYMFYTVFGTLVLLVVAMIVSWLTGWEDTNKLNPNLITPTLHFLLPKSNRGKKQENKEYIAVAQVFELNERTDH